MAGTKRESDDILKDGAEIAVLYFEEGLTQAQIAKRLQISQPTVSRHVRTIREKWLTQQIDSYTKHLSQKIARSEARYEEAREAWEASKEPKKVTETRGGKGIASTATVRSEEQNGDPRFLEAMRREDEFQSKLLGLLTERVDVNQVGQASGISADALADAASKARESVQAWRAARSKGSVH